MLIVTALVIFAIALALSAPVLHHLTYRRAGSTRLYNVAIVRNHDASKEVCRRVARNMDRNTWVQLGGSAAEWDELTGSAE